MNTPRVSCISLAPLMHSNGEGCHRSTSTWWQSSTAKQHRQFSPTQHTGEHSAGQTRIPISSASLAEHGVNICVCGQAFLNQGFRKHDLNQDVTLALSVLTVLPIYQLKGYALMTYEEGA